MQDFPQIRILLSVVMRIAYVFAGFQRKHTCLEKVSEVRLPILVNVDGTLSIFCTRAGNLASCSYQKAFWK